MKKVFCFSLIAIIIALASAPALVKADDITVVTPYVDTPILSQAEIDQYTYSTMLMEYLRMGGTIDVKNKSDNYSALDLLEDFGGFVKEVIGDVVDIINPFQSEFQWGKGWPLDRATPAMLQLMGLLPFYAFNPSDNPEPTPNPPNQYSQLIDIINGSGFHWRDWTPTYGNNILTPVVPTNIKGMSWVKSANYNINVSSYPSPIITITINGDDTNGYDILYSGYSVSTNTYCDDNNRIMYSTNIINEPNLYASNIFRAYYGNNYYSNSYFANNFGHFNTITDALSNISNFFRNVNIYVNGDLWAYVGSGDVNYNIELSTSTVTPSGERVRWMYDKEIYVDMDKIVERLQDILDTIDSIPNTPTIIKFDDLDDVIVDVNGIPAIAVKVINNELSLDDRYLEDFGPIIPLFVPMFTPVINDTDIISITDVSTSALPAELLEVCGYVFVGTLFACFIHRLLE